MHGCDADHDRVGRLGYEAHFVCFWRFADHEITDMCIFRAGWPCLALGGEALRIWRTDHEFDRQAFAVWLPETSWNAGRDMYSEFNTIKRSIPLRPIWPGFAINTILYAGILWLVFLAPFQVRRYRRIKRGLCPACAYPIGTSDVCTECGNPVPARASPPEIG